MKETAALKKIAAQAALDYIQLDTVIGVGTGTTVNYFIEALASVKGKIDHCIASSHATHEKLKAYGLPTGELNSVNAIDLYVDGADELIPSKALIKGGGGALTREKILAYAAKQFICIADESKMVRVLGQHAPIPVEVIPMARSMVARQLVKLGGAPEYREGFITDNGNTILDVYHLPTTQPTQLESTLNNIPGVVSCGIFAQNIPSLILLGEPAGVKIIQ